MMHPYFEYDVFLSHSSRDNERVRELANRLRKDGIEVWFDEWSLRPGDLIPLQIEKALEASRALLVFISKAALESEWVTLERQTTLFRDPTNALRRFIPVLLEDVVIPDMLRQFYHIDWRSASADAYSRLLAACRPAPEDQLRVADEADTGAFVISAHSKTIAKIEMIRRGLQVISASQDGTLKVWDVRRHACIKVIQPGVGALATFGVSPGESRVVSVGTKRRIVSSDLVSEAQTTLTNLPASALAFTNESHVVTGDEDGFLCVFNATDGRLLQSPFRGHSGPVTGIAVPKEGPVFISSGTDGKILLFTGPLLNYVVSLEGHSGPINSIAITARGELAVSGGADGTVRLWDLQRQRCVATLEGHIDGILRVAVTGDGRWAHSLSLDRTLRVWNIRDVKCVASIEVGRRKSTDLAVGPTPEQCLTASTDGNISFWSLGPALTRRTAELDIRYTNAKVLLAGDSGVGKTGLAIRLTKGKFEWQYSTDAAWATQLQIPRPIASSLIEREIWLWDFAGQADYRLIHQLFMDETALAMLVFNPQSEDPFDGLSVWDRALTSAARRPFTKVLVAGRCDRGGLMVSRASIEGFMQARGFKAFIETSALTGLGCGDLLKSIVDNIDWENLPWTASPVKFKQLKEEILKLRSRGKTILRLAELKQQLEMSLPALVITQKELSAVVGLLAGPGITWLLEFGDFVLLQP